jgi:hypothetical protein
LPWFRNPTTIFATPPNTSTVQTAQEEAANQLIRDNAIGEEETETLLTEEEAIKLETNHRNQELFKSRDADGELPPIQFRNFWTSKNFKSIIWVKLERIGWTKKTFRTVIQIRKPKQYFISPLGDNLLLID